MSHKKKKILDIQHYNYKQRKIAGFYCFTYQDLSAGKFAGLNDVEVVAIVSLFDDLLTRLEGDLLDGSKDDV